MNVDEELKKAVDVQKYATTHVKTNWLKLFMDGTVEGGTGFVEPLYPDGHQGLANWTEEELTDITRKANAKGLSMHIHTMGNKAVNYVVSAYANAGKDELRNTLVHVRNVNAEDYQRMADHNMYAVSGMLWHHCPSFAADYIREHKLAPVGQEAKSYPMKSYFDNGINMTSHSDFPATSGSPDDPFGIIEIAVTGVFAGENGNPWWPEELITREQAIEALTINAQANMPTSSWLIRMCCRARRQRFTRLSPQPPTSKERRFTLCNICIDGYVLKKMQDLFQNMRNL